MAIHFQDDRYYIGLWYAPLCKVDAPRGGNLMVCAWRQLDEPNHWTLQLRFRYYRDRKAFDSEDVFNWYEATFNNMTEAEVEKIVEQAVGLSTQVDPSDPQVADFFPIRGNGAVAAERIWRAAPEWMQFQESPSTAQKDT